MKLSLMEKDKDVLLALDWKLFKHEGLYNFQFNNVLKDG